MRRVVGLTLTGLGAFFLVVALLMRFYLPGQVVKFPLNWYSQMTLVGHNMTYFSPKEFKQLSGITMRAISTVSGDVAAGSSSVAVWNNITGVEDTTTHQPVSYTSQRSAFNRSTGVLVNCCGAHINGNTTVRQSGQGYVWPFNTQQQTYQLFNVLLLKPWPATFQGTDTVDGLSTDKFVQQINNQQIGTQNVSGSLVGLNATSVNLPEYLTATDTYWVDPVTGAPLKVTEDQTESLADSSGTTRLILYQGTLASTPQSIAGAISVTHSARDKIGFFQDVGPLIGLLLGIVLLVIGVTMFAIAPQRLEHVESDDEGHGGGDDSEPGGARGEADHETVGGQGSEQADSNA
jgi:hypothetical protein